MNLRTEMLKLIRLALPVAMAQLLIAAAGLVDTVMAGAAGVSDLAGVSLGSAIWITLTVLAMGLLMAVNPVVAQYAGARRYREITNFMHQALRVAVVLALVFFILIRLHPGYLLGLSGRVVAPMGAEGFWIALVVGLGISGILMSNRLWRLSRCLTRPQHSTSNMWRAAA